MSLLMMMMIYSHDVRVWDWAWDDLFITNRHLWLERVWTVNDFEWVNHCVWVCVCVCVCDWDKLARRVAIDRGQACKHQVRLQFNSDVNNDQMHKGTNWWPLATLASIDLFPFVHIHPNSLAKRKLCTTTWRTIGHREVLSNNTKSNVVRIQSNRTLYFCVCVYVTMLMLMMLMMQ